MGQGTVELSLKRQDGTWGGLTDASSMESGVGSFQTIENAVPNRDGSELRRSPGSKEVGRPGLSEPFAIGDVTEFGGVVTVTLLDPDGTLSSTEGWHGMTAGSARVYFQGNTGGFADGWYDVTPFGAFQFQITISVTLVPNKGYVFAQRCTKPHLLVAVDDRPVVVGRTEYALAGSSPISNVGSWVGSQTVDPGDVEDPGSAYLDAAASTASRTQRTTDSGFIIWRSPTMRTERGDQDNAFTGGSAAFQALARLFAMNWKSRASADVLNSRLVIAVPGHGCCFEVDLARDRWPIRINSLRIGSGASHNVPDHRWTKALGIPRGLLPDQSGSATMITWDPLGGQPGWTSGDQIYVAVAYYNPVTRELGLASEVALSPVTTSSSGRFSVAFAPPRTALGEVGPLQTIIYASEPGSPPVSSAALFPVATIDLDSYDSMRRYDSQSNYYNSLLGGYAQVAEIVSPPAPTNTIEPRRFPSIEQMPKGASWIRVCRGRAMMGGDQPRWLAVRWRRSTPSKAERSRALVLPSSDADGSPVEGTAYIENNFTAGVLTTDALADGFVVPPAYEGARFDSAFDSAGEQVIRTGTLVKRLNGDQDIFGSGVGILNGLYEFDGRVANNPSNDVYGYIQRDDDTVQFSEEGKPGVVAGVSRLPVDTIKGNRTTGMARVGDDGLVFTNRETFLFVWSMLPRVAASRVLTNEYGCIAPSSVVEGNGFACWMSAEGPMLYVPGRGIRWLGAQIHDLWRTIVRQSDGMADHIQGVYDRERSLVIWQVATSFDDDTDDLTKSETKGTLLLVYAFQTDSFYTISRADASKPHCLGTLPVNESAKSHHYWAPAYVAGTTYSDFFSIQMLDDRYQDQVDTPSTETASADRSPGSDNFETGATISFNKFTANDQAFVRSPAGVLRWWGTISSQSGTALVLNDTEESNWKSGDEIEGRVIHMRLVTNYVRAGDIGYDMIVRGFVLRLDTYQDPDASYTAYSWCRVRLERQDGTFVNLCRNKWGDPVSDGTTRISSGQMKAQDVRVHIDLISNVQLRVKDMALELENQR